MTSYYIKILMDYTLVDYVWLGGKGELRSKTRVVYRQGMSLSAHGDGYQKNLTLENIPEWNYDGSSTEQADGHNSEIFIKPRRMFRCPFRRPRGLIVLCDTYDASSNPIPTNHRYHANEIFTKYADQKPWFGLEQEYFIYDLKTEMPIGFDPLMAQGQFYCGVGGNNAFGRMISDEHLECCLYSGIKISGTNAEVAPAQWEFQIINEGIDAADQLWIARYILQKISEKYHTYIVFHPKPLKDFNGSGLHTNFSTEAMRNEDGLDVIYKAVEKLGKKHEEHMKIYGEDNKLRMTGLHETSSYDKFTYGIANRSCSVRIGTDTFKNRRGYAEDRRVSSNADPYLVTSKIMETIMEP